MPIPKTLRPPLVMLALLVPVATLAAPGGCQTEAQNQQAAAHSDSQELSKLNTELDRIYQAIVVKYKDDPEFIERFQAAQTAWLAFRHAALLARFPAANPQQRYGSVYPQCADRLLIDLTRERIRQLREWLDGREEGELCTGSVRTK